MKLSVITAVFNNKSHLQECISSVGEQSYSDIEHIIIDGGSADGTLNLLQNIQSSSIRWISEPDKGIYDALNKGLSMATGDIIGILHSDDLFYSPKILEQVMQMFKTEDCDAVYGDLVYVSREEVSKIIRYWKSSPFKPSLLKKGWMPPHPTLFMKRKWYEQASGFRTDFRIAADYDLILRVFKNSDFKPVYLPQIITTMRLGGASNRSLKNIYRKSYEDYIALKENGIGGFSTLFLKNSTKLIQFINRKK